MENNREVLAEFALSAGEMLLVSGAEMRRVEDTVCRILETGGCKNPEVFALPTGIFMAVHDDSTVSAMHRVKAHRTDLTRICRVNQLSREFCGGKLTLEEASAELDRIAAVPDYRLKARLVGYILTCSFFAMMFGGGAIEILAAGGIGLLLALALEALSKIAVSDFIRMLLGGFAVGVSALLFQRTFMAQMNLDAVIIGSLMPLVPGATLTMAIRDTISGDYSAGTARLAEAVVTAMAIATGVAAAMILFRN